jgi:hypothetical protein
MAEEVRLTIIIGLTQGLQCGFWFKCKASSAAHTGKKGLFC